MDRTSRRRLVAASMVLTGAGVLAGASLGPASAAPPNSPDGILPHSHHVHTGDGGCVDIDAVLFNPDHRGLHRGANASGPTRGPWHGTCDSRIYPGGPTLASIGFPVHH